MEISNEKHDGYDVRERKGNQSFTGSYQTMGIGELHAVPKPSHSRRVKKRGERSKFSKMVRDQVKEHFNNQCAQCGKRACHVHHVMPRSQSGRNVFTNALLLCNDCHKEVHANNDLLRHWKEVFRKQYGPLYFMDADDLKMKYLTQELHEEDNEVREWKRNNEVIYQRNTES